MRFSRRHWLAPLACLAATGLAGAQGTVAGGSAAAVDGAGTGAAAGSPAGGTGWHGAPVSISGSVSYDLRANHSREEPSTVSHLVTTHLSAHSYIYQPWFATVSGTLGLTVGRSHSRPGSDGAASLQNSADAYDSNEQFVTGGVNLNLFPRSRFPFGLHLERNDSRVENGSPVSLDVRAQTVGITQRYQPESGAYSVRASYDRRQQSSASVRDTQDVLAADFSSRWKFNDLSVAVSLSETQREASAERSQFRSVVGRHHFAPAQPFSIDTTINLTQTQETSTAAPLNNTVLQAYSMGLWRQPGSGLTLTGAVRGLLLRDGTSDRRFDSLGLTLGANLDVSRNARLTGSASAVTIDNSGVATRAWTASVGANWQAEPVEWQGFVYEWFASGSASVAATGGASADNQSNLAGQFGHSVGRTWPMAPDSALALKMSQSLSAMQLRSTAGVSPGASQSPRNLVHSLGLTWTTSAESRSAYARLSYSGSSELGGEHARFEMLNFQLSGNFEFGQNRSLAGDLTYQWVRQRSGEPQPGDPLLLLGGVRTGSTGASGEITYSQRRLFGVPRLRFTSRLRLAQDVLKQPGVLVAVPDRETRLWENRLDWQVGRLDTQLLLRVSDVDGRRRESLMWRGQRSFGN